MNTYWLLIKTGTEYDIERTIEANSKKEAVDIAIKWLGWTNTDRGMVERNIIDESTFNHE